MSKRTPLKNRLTRTIFGVIFAILSIFGVQLATNLSTPVNAETATEATPIAATNATSETTARTASEILLADAEDTVTDSGSSDSTDSAESAASSENSGVTQAEETCYDQVGAIAWIVCPSSGALGKAIDAIYSQIEKLLVVDPMVADTASPIYNIWQIMRDITNIVFVIVLLIVIYSQITGLGINNYGIKKVLPKLIVSAVLINLSYLICAIAVDASNIIGASAGGIFDNIQVQAINSGGLGSASQVTWTQLTTALIGGGAVAGLGVATAAAGLGGFLWPLLGVLIGGILSVLVGLVTLGLRQALISMLVMIAPLAFVAYLLPNTESWFKRWKDTFISMLIFYPMFSLLFGAAKLAGWAMIASALSSGSTFGLILGMAVQVFPLIASVSLMKMSGTILGKISSKLDGIADKPRALAKDWTGSQAELSRLRHINHSSAPSAGIRRFLDNRRTLREENIKNENTTRTSRSQTYAQRSILGTQKYKPEELNQSMKATRATRGAKAAHNAAMELQTATEDATHVLNNYGDYYKSDLRDKKLADQALHGFHEATRSSLALVNDDEADIEYLTSEWVKIANKGHDSWEYKHFIRGAAGALGEKGTESVLGQIITKAATNEARHRKDTAILMNKFKYNKTDARNMIVGYYVNDNGLAVDKQGNELEKIPGYLLKRAPEKLVPYDKLDENGKPYYDMVDQDGKFISRVYKEDGAAMKELLSNFDMPINDPINGLYGILAGHAEGETYSGDRGIPVTLDNVGLARYRTTIGRAILSSHFKEKAAFAGPMYATSVMNGEIKDYTHQFIARLDNLDKTGKAGNFNTQDAFEFSQLAMMMQPENWPDIFRDDSLRTFRNVNSELMKASAFEKDANGNFILDENGNKIPALRRDDDGNIVLDKNGNKVLADRVARDEADESKIEELRRTLYTKYLQPNSKKFLSMFARYTQGTADNQKPGTASPIKNLYSALQSWSDPETAAKIQAEFAGIPPTLDDPFTVQSDNFVYTSKEIRDKILPRKKDEKSAYSNNDPASSSTIVNSHDEEPSDDENNHDKKNSNHIENKPKTEKGKTRRHEVGTRNDGRSEGNTYTLGDVLTRLEEIYYSCTGGDSREFAEQAMDYLDSSPTLEGCANDFSEYTFANPYATADELYEELTDIVTARLYD